jgi:predicted RNA-binding Zn ribbon-like protein
MIDREDALLWLLNSAPAVNGEIVEALEINAETRRHLSPFGDIRTPFQIDRLRALRDDLQSVIRGQLPAPALLAYFQGVVKRAEIDDEGLGWAMDGPAEVLPAAHAVEEWARVTRSLPGRLRPCTNVECNKFLIDHSRPNIARWCSMAECGNRLKARRHQARLMSGHKALILTP